MYKIILLLFIGLTLSSCSNSNQVDNTSIVNVDTLTMNCETPNWEDHNVVYAEIDPELLSFLANNKPVFIPGDTLVWSEGGHEMRAPVCGIEYEGRIIHIINEQNSTSSGFYNPTSKKVVINLFRIEKGYTRGVELLRLAQKESLVCTLDDYIESILSQELYHAQSNIIQRDKAEWRSEIPSLSGKARYVYFANRMMDIYQALVDQDDYMNKTPGYSQMVQRYKCSMSSIKIARLPYRLLSSEPDVVKVVVDFLSSNDLDVIISNYKN
jgi:hypothetical protein